MDMNEMLLLPSCPAENGSTLCLKGAVKKRCGKCLSGLRQRRVAKGAVTSIRTKRHPCLLSNTETENSDYTVTLCQITPVAVMMKRRAHLTICFCSANLTRSKRRGCRLTIAQDITD